MSAGSEWMSLCVFIVVAGSSVLPGAATSAESARAHPCFPELAWLEFCAKQAHSVRNTGRGSSEHTLRARGVRRVQTLT